MSKVLIATGGTGGHIYPAIAIGEFLKEKNVEIVYTGRKNSLEEKLIEKRGFKILTVKAEKFKGVSLLKKLKLIFKIFKLVIDCVKILKKEKPDFVIGTGGYVAAPVIIAAKLLNIKAGICEQNAYMGFGNRVLSFIVDYIFLSFKNTFNVPLKYKAVITGNFIRKEFNNIFYENNTEKIERNILVFGGSQGAKSINEIFSNLLNKLSEIENLKIFHITGKHSFNEIVKKYEPFKDKLKYEIYEYYEDIYKILEKATLVVCRAGATSIAEIFYTKKRAVLIPYPYATDNHQWYNGMELCKTGKSVVLKESFLNSDKLFKWIEFFLKNDRFKGNYQTLGDYRKGLMKIYEIVMQN